MTLGLFRKPAPARRPEPTDEQLLTFEAAHSPGAYTGLKDEAIRKDLGIRPARYYQLLGRLIWLEEALAIDPMLTNRLRRLARDRQIERDRRHGRR